MRIADRAMLFASVLLLVGTAAGCKELDGRNRTRQGNRLFRERQPIDAAAQYEKALTEVDSPIIHYNLGLAYSKVFKPGADDAKPVLLGLAGSFVCKSIPNTKVVAKQQVCVKEGDRRYDACDAKNVCASSFKCETVDMCGLDNSALADRAAEHFAAWLKDHPKDTETRSIMTQVWIDSEQYPKALGYWQKLLDAKPNDPEIMGNLAGISLKAGDWRKSIEWYLKVADAAKDPAAKVGAYQFIGNVAWSKLNSRSLSLADSLELADRGIGALELASALAPKNPKLVGLMASIFNFRSLTQGASWAAALDRASAQDRQRQSHVLVMEAKKAAESQAPAPDAPKDTPAPSQGAASKDPNPASTGG
jgi:tetratricopeptide (TPR) repeat protein